MAIPTPQTVIDWVDQMGVSEKQPEGIQFTGLDGKITIHDLDLNRADDDDNNSNASNKNFVHDKEYQKEFDNNLRKEDKDLNTNGTQEDHFRLPFQQHNALLTTAKARRECSEIQGETLVRRNQ